MESIIETGFLEVRGSKLYYEFLRKEPVIIYLHGNITNHTAFNRQRAHFHEMGSGSLATDLRGMGKSITSESPMKPEDCTLDSYTADLEALVNAKGIKKATLVGHSMGSMIAQSYAAKHPEEVEALVVISGSHDFDKTMPKTIKTRLLQRTAPFLDMLLTGYNRAAGLFIHNREQYYPDFSSEKFKNISDVGFIIEHYKMNSPAYLEALQAITPVNKWRTTELAQKINAPTLIIHGRKDPLIDFKAAYDLRDMIPGARGIEPVIIPDGSHGVNFEQPEQVIAAMEKFLVREIYHGRLMPVSK